MDRQYQIPIPFITLICWPHYAFLPEFKEKKDFSCNTSISRSRAKAFDFLLHMEPLFPLGTSEWQWTIRNSKLTTYWNPRLILYQYPRWSKTRLSHCCSMFDSLDRRRLNSTTVTTSFLSFLILFTVNLINLLRKNKYHIV